MCGRRDLGALSGAADAADRVRDAARATSRRCSTRCRRSTPRSSPIPTDAGRRVRAAAAVLLGRRAAAAACRQVLEGAVRHRHLQRRRLDRDGPPVRDQSSRTRSSTARRACRSRATSCGWSTNTATTSPTTRSASCWCAARSAAVGYWNQREKSRRTFVGEWTRTGDKYLRRADGVYSYCGRTDDMFKVERHLGVAVRGRGGAGQRIRSCSRRRWCRPKTTTA